MMPVDPKPARPTTGHRVVMAAHQAGVRPLPGWSIDDDHGAILTRWHLTEAERRAILDGDDVWIMVSTFGHPLQPLAVATKASEIVEGWPDA